MDTAAAVTIPSDEIERASRALASALASDPPIEVALTVSEALAVLSDVTPPYPPLPEHQEPTDVRTAVKAAIQDLRCALDRTKSVEERLRLAHVLRLLHPLDPDTSST
jgi:hypothetical protein